VNRHKAIAALYPNAAIIDDGAGAFDKDGNAISLDESAINAWVDPNLYADNRAIAYPSIGDQLDLLYKDMVAGKGDSTGEWFKAVKAVKDANPKP
jgi:hypothetical protein